MSRILLATLLLGLSGCKLEGVSRGPMVLVCHTPNGVESFRSEQSRYWYASEGTWFSYDGSYYRQSMYESCGARMVTK